MHTIIDTKFPKLTVLPFGLDAAKSASDESPTPRAAAYVITQCGHVSTSGIGVGCTQRTCRQRKRQRRAAHYVCVCGHADVLQLPRPDEPLPLLCQRVLSLPWHQGSVHVHRCSANRSTTKEAVGARVHTTTAIRSSTSIANHCCWKQRSAHRAGCALPAARVGDRHAIGHQACVSRGQRVVSCANRQRCQTCSCTR